MGKDGNGNVFTVVSADLTAPRSIRAGPGSICIFSSRAPDKQSSNEDAAMVVGCDEMRCVLAVADGLGGHPSGGQAAAIALEELCGAIQQTLAQSGELRDGILNGFEKANASVRTLCPGAGTTLAAVEVDTSTIRTYHAGDSAILAVGQRGSLRWQTVAHSPVGYAVESGLLDAGEAMHHDERHIVLNMVGTEDMRIDIGPPVKLKLRDTVLLATDGLTDNLHNSEIIEKIRKGPLEAAAKRLRDTCADRMTEPKADQPSKPDDVTFILFRPGG